MWRQYNTFRKLSLCHHGFMWFVTRSHIVLTPEENALGRPVRPRYSSHINPWQQKQSEFPKRWILNPSLYCRSPENTSNIVAVEASVQSLWSGNLLLVFANTVILGLGPRGTYDNIFLSQDSVRLVCNLLYTSSSKIRCYDNKQWQNLSAFVTVLAKLTFAQHQVDVTFRMWSYTSTAAFVNLQFQLSENAYRILYIQEDSVQLEHTLVTKETKQVAFNYMVRYALMTIQGIWNGSAVRV
jgi:hypothetical protein